MAKMCFAAVLVPGEAARLDQACRAAFWGQTTISVTFESANLVKPCLGWLGWSLRFLSVSSLLLGIAFSIGVWLVGSPLFVPAVSRMQFALGDLL